MPSGFGRNVKSILSGRLYNTLSFKAQTMMITDYAKDNGHSSGALYSFSIKNIEKRWAFRVPQDTSRKVYLWYASRS